MSTLTLERGGSPARDTVVDAGPDRDWADPFPYPFEHLGREFETVMGDVTLCCSTCCTCSSGGKQQPR
jgi:hypothetical protein